MLGQSNKTTRIKNQVATRRSLFVHVVGRMPSLAVGHGPQRLLKCIRPVEESAHGEADLSFSNLDAVYGSDEEEHNAGEDREDNADGELEDGDGGDPEDAMPHPAAPHGLHHVAVLEDTLVSI